MASGGYRGNAGRPLDSNSFNAAKGKHDDLWLTLSEPSGVVPEWPLTDASDRELSLWEKLWKRMQASQWETLGLDIEVALYTRYLVEAEEPGAKSATRTLVKQYQELLGLSTAGLKMQRWVIPTSVSPVQSGQSSRKPRSSSRGRLKVVGGDDD